MTVSRITPDARRAKRTVEFFYVVRAGALVEIRRGADLERLQAERADLIGRGARAV